MPYDSGRVHEAVLENAIRRAMNEAYSASKVHGRKMFLVGLAVGGWVGYIIAGL